MRFIHEERFIDTDDRYWTNHPFIMLTSEDDIYEVAAEAITLDIRGNYGSHIAEIEDFINSNDEDYIWSGNSYNVSIKKNKDCGTIVIIEDQYSESRCEMEISEWLEALNDWKEFYLSKMGFKKFEFSIGLSHLYSVILLVYDKICIEDTYIPIDIYTYSLSQCAERYGIKVQTLYAQCCKEAGVYSIHEFYYYVSIFILHKKEELVNRIVDANPEFKIEIEKAFKEILEI